MMKPTNTNDAFGRKATVLHNLSRKLTSLVLCAILLLSASFFSALTGGTAEAKGIAAKLLRLPGGQVVRSQQRPGRISLTFNKTDIRDVLSTIAQYAGVDVLVTPGATGAITLNLRQ